MSFMKFKNAVAHQFAQMSKGELFYTDVEKDKLWDTYLESFPEGSNPIYRKRTEHDCSCCRSFIKRVGNVVSIKDNKIITIWDNETGYPAYDEVTEAMAKLVRSAPIVNRFLSPERVAGTDKNFEEMIDHVHTWHHFFVNIPSKFVKDGKLIGPELSESRASYDVLFRSLNEITDEAVGIVEELIEQNSLYRGEEHKHTISQFKKAKKEFRKVNDSKKTNFVWANIDAMPASVKRIRNTSIGTLLVDISEGVDLDRAVRSFESMVAPANYRRPTAVVTQAMIDKAKKEIEELGLTSALKRRYANMSDVDINNIIFISRRENNVIFEDIFDSIAVGTSKPKKLDKVETVPIEKFISDIVPKAKSIEIMFENNHVSNLVSLIAPVDPTANKLFKWDNLFSWSYNGDMADSIKERVKNAGGNVTGDLCCRLAWYNYDDLDFHMREPMNGDHIYFGFRGPSRSGGRLDVDMNAGSGTTREPVENIFYETQSKMREGVYELLVHQYSKRETKDVGFDVEIDALGGIYKFTYSNAVKQSEYIPVADIRYSKKEGFEVIPKLPASKSTVSKEYWGIGTNKFHKVNVIMKSPNYWDGKGVGNKHYFFIIDKCKNDDKARGFFNEFLSPELDKHRKVFEVIGNKIKTEESDNQVSGLGFSSTKRASFLAKVESGFNRIIKVEV